VPLSHKTPRSRWYRGLLSAVGAPIACIGRFCGGFVRQFRDADRYQFGLVIILPGIEAQSFLNQSVAWGLADGGWHGAIEIDDWTTSNAVLFAYHLRGWQRNLRQAERIAQRIVAYQNEFPGRPVYLFGHSGGGAITVLTLEHLPPDRSITGAIVLAPAISRKYPLSNALLHTDHGLWNFWSPFDLFFLGLGTVALGTLDGRHQVSAGLLGFQEPADLSDAERQLYRQKLHQIGYSAKMARAFHLGGHFGCVNRVFVAEYLTPLLRM
jgi:pimeloyl-ACP methyl ester carboxylesterase